MSSAVSPSHIDANEVYHVEEFRRRVGWGQHAFRRAKRRGLRVVHTAGRCYVRGADFVRYLDEVAQDAAQGAGDGA